MKASLATLLALHLLFFSLRLTGEDQEAVFSQAELDQMLAPIALYPDALLAQILTASTYPLEIVEAARWSRDHPGLEGEEAVEAVADQDWDPSVKALVAFPTLLERMDKELSWTRQLGDAFLLQEEDVLTSIQALRERAYAAGNLESLEHLHVKREREVIVIEPADPKIIYVPYYRPTVIYGTWWWPYHPPVYWGPPTSYYSVHYSSGRTRVVWTSGVVIRSGFFFSTCDWHRRQVVVHHHHHHHHHSQPKSGQRRPSADWSRYSSPERWQHEPAHRRGVRYRNDSLNERYGRSMASRRTDRSERWEQYSEARRQEGLSSSRDPFRSGDRISDPASRLEDRTRGESGARANDAQRIAPSQSRDRQQQRRERIASSPRPPSHGSTQGDVRQPRRSSETSPGWARPERRGGAGAIHPGQRPNPSDTMAQSRRGDEEQATRQERVQRWQDRRAGEDRSSLGRERRSSSAEGRSGEARPPARDHSADRPSRTSRRARPEEGGGISSQGWVGRGGERRR